MTRRETATKAISGGSERFQSVKTQKTDGRKMVFCRFFFRFVWWGMELRAYGMAHGRTSLRFRFRMEATPKERYLKRSCRLVIRTPRASSAF